MMASENGPLSTLEIDSLSTSQANAGCHASIEEAECDLTSNPLPGIHGYTEYAKDSLPETSSMPSHMDRLHAMSHHPLTMTGISGEFSLPEMSSIGAEDSLTKAGPLTVNPSSKELKKTDVVHHSKSARSSERQLKKSPSSEVARDQMLSIDKRGKTEMQNSLNSQTAILGDSLDISTILGSPAVSLQASDDELGQSYDFAGLLSQLSLHDKPPQQLQTSSNGIAGSSGVGTGSSLRPNSRVQHTLSRSISIGIESYKSFQRASMISQGKEEMLKEMSQEEIKKMADSCSEQAWSHLDSCPRVALLQFEESIQHRHYLDPNSPGLEETLSMEFYGAAVASFRISDYIKALEYVKMVEEQVGVSPALLHNVSTLKRKVSAALGDVQGSQTRK